MFNFIKRWRSRKETPQSQQKDTILVEEPQETLAMNHVTARTGSVQRKLRKKGGGYRYERTHTSVPAYNLHIAELKARSAAISTDGLVVGWHY